MARKKGQIWVTVTYFERWFGIQPKVLETAGVISEENPKTKYTEYNLDDFFNKCGPIILDRLSSKYNSDGSDDTNLSLRDRKTKAETTKLEIEAANKLIDLEVRKGNLCKREDVVDVFGKSMKQIADKLDTVPSRVKQENPTVSQNVLATIQSVMIEVRNNMTDYDDKR